MDNGKLGALDLPTPQSMLPKGATLTYFEEEFEDSEIVEFLEGGGLCNSEYYGCWSIWKTEEGYSGELLQYGSVTDSFINQPLAKAIEKVRSWHQTTTEDEK